MRKKIMILLIILNVFLLIVSILCLIGTCKNDMLINTASSEYTYCESENGRVVLTLETGEEVTLQFGKNAVKVFDSYAKSSRKEALTIVMFARNYASKKGYDMPRKNTELYGEYRLHAFLYELGIERQHTADSDLDYIQDRRWYINIASKVIGWMGI